MPCLSFVHITFDTLLNILLKLFITLSFDVYFSEAFISSSNLPPILYGVLFCADAVATRTKKAKANRAEICFIHEVFCIVIDLLRSVLIKDRDISDMIMLSLKLCGIKNVEASI